MPAPVIIIDTREPSPHPWVPWWPTGTAFEYGTLETGDFAVKGFEDGAVVERKTATDFLGCIGDNRDRFEMELRRSRRVGHFIVIVSASLHTVIREARIIHPAAIIGTVAAWTRRYCPIVFADNDAHAAALCLRWILQPLEEAAKVYRKTSGESP